MHQPLHCAEVHKDGKNGTKEETYMSVCNCDEGYEKKKEQLAPLREGACHVLQWLLARPSLPLCPVKPEKKNVPETTEEIRISRKGPYR